LLISCQREDVDVSIPGDIIIEEKDTFFDSQFIGIVQDVSGLPLQNVKVVVGNTSDISSDNGIFIIKNAKTNSSGSFIHFSKEGYFDQYVFLTKSSDAYSNIFVTLQKKTNFLSFSGDADRDIQVSDYFSVNISSGSFTTPDQQVYSGTVRVYTSFSSVSQNVPVISDKLTSGLFSEGQNIHLYFESSDSVPLKQIKPITVTALLSGFQLAVLDPSKNKWKQRLATEVSGVHQITWSENLPIATGKFVPLTRVQSRIVSPSQTGVSLTSVEITAENNASFMVFPDQNGYLDFYTPSDNNLNIQIKDVCGQTLVSTSVPVGKDKIQILPDMVTDSSYLTTIRSQIEACASPINGQDLINVFLQENDKALVLYQYQNDQIFVVPSCVEVKKATYYRGKQKQFSVSFSGQQNKTMLDINASPLCIEKVSGYFSINDVVTLLDEKQFTILREGQNKENVVVTDLNGFVISIPGVNGPGNYTPDAIFFNHPDVTDCYSGDCAMIEVRIDEISVPGAVVKIRLEGQMSGDKIRGEFVNTLKN
jgi:hypothetical protein